MFRLVRRLPCGFPYACTHTGVAVRPACAWMEWAERARGSSLCAPTQLQHAHARRPHAAFSRHGTVKDVTMKEGYCFVIFENSADVEDVIRGMDGYVHTPRAAHAAPPAAHPVRTTVAHVAPASVAAVPVGALQKAEASRVPGKGKGETCACSGFMGGMQRTQHTRAVVAPETRGKVRDWTHVIEDGLLLVLLALQVRAKWQKDQG
jgi:hypothetical protein